MDALTPGLTLSDGPGSQYPKDSQLEGQSSLGLATILKETLWPTRLPFPLVLGAWAWDRA